MKKYPRQVLSIDVLDRSFVGFLYIVIVSLMVLVIYTRFIKPWLQGSKDDFTLTITIKRETNAPLSVNDQLNFLDQVQKLQNNMRSWMVETNKKAPSAHVTSRDYLHLGKNFDGVMKNPKLLDELHSRIKPNNQPKWPPDPASTELKLLYPLSPPK